LSHRRHSSPPALTSAASLPPAHSTDGDALLPRLSIRPPGFGSLFQVVSVSMMHKHTGPQAASCSTDSVSSSWRARLHDGRRHPRPKPPLRPQRSRRCVAGPPGRRRLRRLCARGERQRRQRPGRLVDVGKRPAGEAARADLQPTAARPARSDRAAMGLCPPFSPTVFLPLRPCSMPPPG
jgi:hypothetical protein